MHTLQVENSSSFKASKRSYNDYELSIYAAPEIEDRVKIIQQKFGERYGKVAAIDPKPSITIAAFKAYEAMEETIIRYIHRICVHQKSFYVELKNYGGYPPNVFLRVQNQSPINQLRRNLQPIHDYIFSCSCPAVQTTLYPHINIASSVPDNKFVAALLEYGQETFYEMFEVRHLYLVRKDNRSREQKIINVFGLQQGMPTLHN